MRNTAAEKLIYECVRCKLHAQANEWQYPGTITFKCPSCGYRVARKLRPPITKRVKCL